MTKRVKCTGIRRESIEIVKESKLSFFTLRFPPQFFIPTSKILLFSLFIFFYSLLHNSFSEAVTVKVNQVSQPPTSPAMEALSDQNSDLLKDNGLDLSQSHKRESLCLIDRPKSSLERKFFVLAHLMKALIRL